jgi:hypothetical protein
MRYVSPFQELGIEIDSNLEKSDLNLAKKRLLAELELSSKSTILRGSMEMSKDDIIKQFDKLSSIKNWDFHRLVLADNALLNFVQNKELNANTVFLKEPKYDTPAFVEFISPYFSESYKSLVIKNLAHSSYLNLTAILKLTPRLMTESDHDNVWFSVESFLNGWKSNLDEIAEKVKNRKEYADNEILPFHNKSFIQCLNLLPEDFSWFRDDYATSLFNLSANSWNKKKHYRAIDLVKNARYLHLSKDTEDLLDERIAWFDEQMKDASGTDSSFDWSTTGRVILFALFFIMKLATCDHSSSSPRWTYKPSDYPMAVEAVSEMNDTLMERSVRNTLEKEGIKSKRWDKARFDALLNVIKKSTPERETRLTYTLLVDKCLMELQKMKKMPTEKRTMSEENIDLYIGVFRVIQAERGLK